MRDLLLACMLSGCAHGAYSIPDKVLTGTVATTLAIDYYQTYAEVVPDCTESNPIIGRCGQNVPVAIYFPVTTAAILLASHYMNPKWRTGILGLITGIEAKAILTNYNYYH